MQTSIDILSVIQKIESRYPVLEDAECKVYIGAATGSNKAYIVDDATRHSLEDDRILPTIIARDLKGGNIDWQNKYLTNTYE